MTDNKKIRISAPCVCEKALERLRSELCEAATVDAFDGELCDVLVAVTAPDGMISSKVAADILLAVGQGSAVLPLCISQNAELDADAVSETVNIIKKLCCDGAAECEDICALCEDSCDTECDEAELIDSDAEQSCEEASEEIEDVSEMSADNESDEVDIFAEGIDIDAESSCSEECCTCDAEENEAPAAACETPLDGVPRCECGADIEDGMLFCWNCGRKLATEIVEKPAEVQSALTESMTEKDPAEAAQQTETSEAQEISELHEMSVTSDTAEKSEEGEPVQTSESNESSVESTEPAAACDDAGPTESEEASDITETPENSAKPLDEPEMSKADEASAASDEDSTSSERAEHCSCGAEIMPDTLFCWNCGRRLDEKHDEPTPAESTTSLRCTECGAEVAPGDRFCFACGKPINYMQ